MGPGGANPHHRPGASFQRPLLGCGNKGNHGAECGCVFPSNVSFTLRRCFYKDGYLAPTATKARPRFLLFLV